MKAVIWFLLAILWSLGWWLLTFPVLHIYSGWCLITVPPAVMGSLYFLFKGIDAAAEF